MYKYKAVMKRVIDGDTVVFDIDLGYMTWIHDEHVRLLGIDAPESRTKDLEEKARGLASKAFLESLFEKYGNNVTLQTFNDKAGKYGRMLGLIWFPTETGYVVNGNKLMVESGHAEWYPPVPEEAKW